MQASGVEGSSKQPNIAVKVSPYIYRTIDSQLKRLSSEGALRLGKFLSTPEGRNPLTIITIFEEPFQLEPHLSTRSLHFFLGDIYKLFCSKTVGLFLRGEGVDIKGAEGRH